MNFSRNPNKRFTIPTHSKPSRLKLMLDCIVAISYIAAIVSMALAIASVSGCSVASQHDGFLSTYQSQNPQATKEVVLDALIAHIESAESTTTTKVAAK